MRRAGSLTLPFALLAILALIPCYAALMSARQPPMDAAQPEIVVHLLVTPVVNETDSMLPSPTSTPIAGSTAPKAAGLVPTSLAATSEPIATDTPVASTATANAFQPTDVLSTVARSIPTAASETDWQDGVRHQLLNLHNRARAQAGLPPYRLSLQLQQAAQQQADFLARKPASELMQLGAAGHRGPHGEIVSQRAARFGYAGGHVSENWGYFSTAQDTFDFWLTDPWHRPQVLSVDLIDVGIGISVQPDFGIVFVADYGRQ